MLGFDALGRLALGEAPSVGGVQSGVGTAAGTSTVSAVGRSTNKTSGTIAGVATAAATGKSIPKTSGTIAGTSTAAATGAPRFAAVGTAAGTSTVNGVNLEEGETVGTIAGTSTASAPGAATAASVASSTSSSASVAASGAIAPVILEGVGVADGTATVLAFPGNTGFPYRLYAARVSGSTRMGAAVAGASRLMARTGSR